MSAANTGRPGPFRQLREQITSALQQLRGAIALIGWIVGAYVQYTWQRFNVGRWAHLALLGYVLVLAIEFGLHLYGLAILTGGSLALQAAFVIVMLVSSLDHYRGWRERIQQEFFILAAAKITQLLCETNAKTDTPSEVVDRLLGIFRGNFQKKGAVNVNIFLHRKSDNVLYFKQAYPADAVLDRGFLCPPGKGGSGTSFAEKAVVYIPWRKHGSAILVDTRGAVDDGSNSTLARIAVLPRCLLPDAVAKFESVLSVPILYSGTCYGVLNLDSEDPNVFSIKDFPQAAFYGMVIGVYLNELEKAGRTL